MKNIVKSSLKTFSMVMVLGIYQNFAYAVDNDVSEAAETEVAETEVITVVINGKEITVTLADSKSIEQAIKAVGGDPAIAAASLAAAMAKASPLSAADIASAVAAVEPGAAVAITQAVITVVPSAAASVKAAVMTAVPASAGVVATVIAETSSTDQPSVADVETTAPAITNTASTATVSSRLGSSTSESQVADVSPQ